MSDEMVAALAPYRDADGGIHVDDADDVYAFIARIEAALSSPETTPAGGLDEAALREALTAIADARRSKSDCPDPMNCMIPQAHADDESWSEFADRLRSLATAALGRSGSDR